MFAFGTDELNTEKKSMARKDKWQNVALTPGRIPSFIVLPRLQLSVSPRLGIRRTKETDEYRLLPSSSPKKGSPGIRSPLRLPAKLRFTPQSNRKRAKDSPADPSTRAAMSLEHVDIITTPYGFRTLAARPNVSRRESLFHKRARDVEEENPWSPKVSPISLEDCDSPKLNTKTPRASPSLGTCCSSPKSDRKRLRLLFSKSRSAFKNFTPGRRKNLRKAHEAP